MGEFILLTGIHLAPLPYKRTSELPRGNMARTPYNDPEAEAQYQDNSVENRNQKMAGEIKPWVYSAQDVAQSKAASDAIRPLQITPPAQVINFPTKKK